MGKITGYYALTDGDNMILEKLTQFSNFYGKNPELVLAGGGNTSAKSGRTMFVKPSGTKLADVRAEQFVKIDLDRLLEIFNKSYPENDAEREALVLDDMMKARCAGEESKRPSVETLLHAIFEQTFVLHLHPALVNGLTCSQGAKEKADEILGSDYIWIDACKPGYILSKICYDKMQEYKEQTGKAVDMILLQNHGIFIAADSVEGLGEKLNAVLDALEKRLTAKPDRSLCEENKEVKEKLSDITGGLVLQINTSDAEKFSSSREKALPLLKPFTPDHIVYCKAYPLFIENGTDISASIETYKNKFGFCPRVIIVENTGIFCVGENENQVNTVKMLFEDAMKIAVYSQSFGGYLQMTDELTDFIVNWEVESYRSKQN